MNHRLSPAICAILLAMLTTPALGAAQDRGPGLQLPDLPALQGRQARWVGRLERVARNTLRCEAYEGDRGGEEYSDDRCWEWYDRLSASEEGGVHGSGRALLASLRAGGELESPQVRLVHILGHSRSRAAAPYLLHVLARAQGEQESAERARLASEALAALAQLGQHDAAPIAPWRNRVDALTSPRRRAQALQRWLAWYDGAREQPYRRWRFLGREHAEARLSDDDAAIRFAAIDRLRSERRRHYAIVASLRAMIVQPDLAPEARRYVTRYAGRHGLLTRSQIRELLASV